MKRKLNKNSTILETFDFITRNKCTNGFGNYSMISEEVVEVFRELLRREVEK
jgi:hypothetical protein